MSGIVKYRANGTYHSAIVFWRAIPIRTDSTPTTSSPARHYPLFCPLLPTAVESRDPRHLNTHTESTKVKSRPFRPFENCGGRLYTLFWNQIRSLQDGEQFDISNKDGDIWWQGKQNARFNKSRCTFGYMHVIKKTASEGRLDKCLKRKATMFYNSRSKGETMKIFGKFQSGMLQKTKALNAVHKLSSAK